MQTNPNRQAYLDWLRIMAIAGVLVFHSAMPYAAEEWWHIKNKETSSLIMEFNFWLSRFRMPLLFFISGTVTFFMLKNRSAGSFVVLRIRRLLLPLAFGMLVIVAPQVYFERLTQGYTGNYVNFYGLVFQMEPYPKGNFSWHHLWFIAYLFVYDVIFAPVFKWVMGPGGQRLLGKLNWMTRRHWVYLLAVPSIILYASLNLRFPETNDLRNDWCRIFYWLLFLLAGFICIALPEFMDSLERNRRSSLAIAFLSILAINCIRWNGIEPWDIIPNWRSDARTYLFMALTPVTAWAWVFAGIGYGKKYLNKPKPVLNYLNLAVYPFYIVHQTVIVILTYYIVQTNDEVSIKYLFTIFATLFISMLIFHLFIKPFRITRLLFGMKPAKNKL